MFADEGRSEERDAVDESRREGEKESGQGRRAERTTPIRDKASAGKRLKREKGRGGRVGRRRGGNKQVPEVRANQVCACEEGDLGRGRVKERAGGVSKEGMPVRANERRDTKQRMRQGRGRENVAINRRELVR